MRLKIVISDGVNVDNIGEMPSLDIALPGGCVQPSTRPVAVLRVAYRGELHACVAGIAQMRSAPGTVLVTRPFFLYCLLGLDLNTNSPAAAEAVRIALDDARCGKIECHVDIPARESVDVAARVEIAPVDPEDYELLCMYADQVSQIALAQMHVLSVGQRFPLMLDTVARVSVLLQVASVGTKKEDSHRWKDGDTPDYAWLGNNSELVVLTGLDEINNGIKLSAAESPGEEKVMEETVHAMDGVEAIEIRFSRRTGTVSKEMRCGHHGVLEVPCLCEGDAAKSTSCSLWRLRSRQTPLQFVVKLCCCDKKQCVHTFCGDDDSEGMVRHILPVVHADETIMANIGWAFPDYTSFGLVRQHEKDVYVDAKLSLVSIYILKNNPDTVRLVNSTLSEHKLTIVDLFGRWLQWQCAGGDGTLTTLSNCVVDLSDSQLFEERCNFHAFIVFNGDINTTTYSSCIQLNPQSVHSGTQFQVEDFQNAGRNLTTEQLAVYNSPFFVCSNPSFFCKEAFEETSKNAMDEYNTSSLPLLQQISEVLRHKVQHSLCGGIVVSGKCGTGKTHVLRCLHHFTSNILHCFSMRMDCRSLIRGSNASTAMNIDGDTRITNKFRMIMFTMALCARNASKDSGAVLFLDDFDVIFEETSSAQNGTNFKYATMFSDAFNWIRRFHPNVIVVVSCQNVDYKLPFFSSLAVFSHYFEITTSSYQPLFLLLSTCHSSGCNIVKDDQTTVDLEVMKTLKDKINMSKLERLLKPLSPRDIVNLVTLVRDKDNNVSISSAVRCLETQQLARYGTARSGSSRNESEDASQLGGYKKVLDELRRLVEVPLTYSTLFAEDESHRKARQMLKLNKGILLYGPPGCGKTFIVHNMARALHLNMVTVKGPQLLSKFIGQSEAAVRDVFARAAEAQPSILFFDEFDSLAPRRGHDSTGVTDRVVNQLLTLLDGVDGGTNNSDGSSVVIVVAATNRPDLIDLALLRPGRIETKLYVGYPESLDDAQSVLDAVLSAYPAYKRLLGKHTCELMAEHAWKEHLSPADIRHAVHSAVTSVVKKTVASRQPEQLPKASPKAPSIQGECFSRRKHHGSISREMVSVPTSAIIPSGRHWQTSLNSSQEAGSCVNDLSAEIVEDEFIHAMELTTASLTPTERAKYHAIFSSFSGRTDFDHCSSSYEAQTTAEEFQTYPEQLSNVSVPPQRQTLA